MNIEFLNPFVEAAMEVLDADTDLTVLRGELALERDPVKVGSVTVVFSIEGRISGMVIYSLADKTALQLVSSIKGKRFDVLDNIAQSGIAEICNVITGRASMKLDEAGYSAKISPPRLILGRDTIISSLELPCVLVPLVTEVGTLAAHLALREVPNTNTVDNMPTPEPPGFDPNSGRLMFQEQERLMPD